MSLPRYGEYKDSGISWVGEVPAHWGALRTKTLFELMKRPPRDEDGVVTAFRDGEVTLRSNRRTDGFTNSLQEIGYQGVRRGDLVIHAMDAFAGAIGVSDSEGKSTPVYSVCKPKVGLSDSRYYARLLRHMALSGFIESLAKGIRERSTEFRWAEAGNVYLPVPPITEQSAIATFLDRETGKIDALIAEQEKLLTLLAEKRQATISYAVTKGLNPDVPMKDSGVAWLGEVPVHWEVMPLKHAISNVKAGPFGSALTKDMYVSEGYRVYGQEQVIPANFTIGDYFIAAEKYAELEQYSVLPGDILISCVGTFGKIAIVPEGVAPGIINPRLIRIRVGKSVSEEYLTTTLRSSVVFEQFSMLSRGGTMDVINIGTLSSIRLPMPPLSEQSTIVDFLGCEVAKLDNLKAEAERAIELLKERRSALIAAAVTGKIDVRDAVIEEVEA